MNITEKFKEDKYVLLEGFLDKNSCHELAEYFRNATISGGHYDDACPTSKAIGHTETLDKLLLDLLPHFEQATGLKLLPTYSYGRVYKPGEILHIHKDRPSCEISATLTLSFDGDKWPIYMSPPVDGESEFYRTDINGNKIFVENDNPISMDVGDAVLYRGCDMYHWRDAYTQGKEHIQVFLHYVDANGPNKEYIFDKRPSLKVPTQFDQPKEDYDLRMWVYDDVLTPKDCDALVKLYTQANSEEAGIGAIAGNVVKEIRNVRRTVLPVHKGIGARLAAAGLDANSQRWNFDIKKANQSEFLRYPAGGGRYKGHLDTFLSKDPKNLEECRKITVLAFLNDDFKGGKFWFQDGHQRFYPPQSKGTVLVFPSFLLHGVEDVEEGERFTCVCWLVGPWFK